MKKVIGIYFMFLAVFSVFTYAFIDPGFFYFEKIFTGLAFSQRFWVTTFYILSLFIFFVFYVIFTHLIQKNLFSKRTIFILVLSTVVFLLPSYPAFISHDIFNYMTTAKITYHYGENPYMVMPIEFTNEQFLSYTRAANKYALYGPVWIFLTALPFFISFQQIILQLFLFKAFISIFYLGTIYLFYKLSKSAYLTALFALNPLVLIETLVSGHNDVVMVFLILSSLYLFMKKKLIIAFIIFTLSVLIKYASIFLLPIFIYIAWKISIKKTMKWDRVWIYSFVSMLAIFLLSPLREELYPWYFLWVFPFALLLRHQIIRLLSLALSFGLLLYYVPYMYAGHYLLIPKLLFVIFGGGTFFLISVFLKNTSMFKDI